MSSSSAAGLGPVTLHFTKYCPVMPSTSGDDATYTGVTPVFWGKLDAVAGPEEWTLFGLTNCGKGQPGQEAHVSHGAAHARFRDVEVGVSA